MGGEAHCNAGGKEKERAREERMRERRESEAERGKGVDGKEKERKRTERRSGQARNAWLESGQAHMRPPSHTHSQQKGFHAAAENISAGSDYGTRCCKEPFKGAVQHFGVIQSQVGGGLGIKPSC